MDHVLKQIERLAARSPFMAQSSRLGAVQVRFVLQHGPATEEELSAARNGLRLAALPPALQQLWRRWKAPGLFHLCQEGSDIGQFNVSYPKIYTMHDYVDNFRGRPFFQFAKSWVYEFHHEYGEYDSPIYIREECTPSDQIFLLAPSLEALLQEMVDTCPEEFWFDRSRWQPVAF